MPRIIPALNIDFGDKKSNSMSKDPVKISYGL